MKKIFTIFVNPVEHSKSPSMHNSCFKAFSIPSCYTKYKLTDGTKLREKIISNNISGANITVPYKEIAYQICDILDTNAKVIGAVNTIIN